MKNDKYDSSQVHLFTSFPETHADDETMEELLANEGQNGNTNEVQLEEEDKKYSVWQMEYYQKYFNADTNEVLMKLAGSITPTFNNNFLINRIRPNPDMYGPFWIITTLIFTIAITGNIASFLRNFGSDFKWHTDFHKVTTSAAGIISYWWLAPTGLYTILRMRQNEFNDFTFIELLSIYGYSLFIYIPISILWLINVSAIQWILVLIAVGLSGNVLFFTFWPTLSQDSNKKVGFGVIILIIILHALLGLSFMLFFFHHPPASVNPNLTTTTATTLSSVVTGKNITG